MKMLLLTIGLSLVAALLAQDPLDLVSEQLDLTGTWYVKAVVDTKEMPVEKRPDKVSPLMVTALEGGDLVITFTIMKKGQCHEKNILLEKTEEPGKYRALHCKKVVQVEELPVKDHYVFYIEDQRRGRPFCLGKLIGRNLDVNFEALKEFKKFTQSKGFLQENIFIPAQMGKCTGSGGSPVLQEHQLSAQVLEQDKLQVKVWVPHCER
ncbi:odorant-binding protein 2b-like [Dasypus novemcinctus]|uniref:odorant-binding protein 2b-like n=1 Tax=Dasypus novemcinctus TaxID=9361 RepID=UPI00265EB99E|nr:odorant-binding protein 2b-like [Dasypus novemcinctus]